jgi:hypothetical protein
MISKDCPLIFTHIPKTGGMSMFASMCEYHGMNMADMYNMSAFGDDTAAVEDVLRDTEKSVYAGHLPFGLHEWLSHPSYYMAIVRKPVDQIMSLYHYSVQYRNFIRHTKKSTNQSYDELFENRTAADFYQDFLPWIKAEQTFNRFLRCPSAELDNGMVRRFSGIGLHPDLCHQDALDTAKNNIEKYYSIVGVQERYADTVRMARMAFGVNLTEFHVNKNADKKKKGPKLSINQRKRIKETNQLDMQLYDWILDRFETQLANPSEPVKVAGGGRTDFNQMKLWRAIGSSPVRQSVMANSPAV